jgi:hypothetical protein
MPLSRRTMNLGGREVIGEFVVFLLMRRFTK